MGVGLGRFWRLVWGNLGGNLGSGAAFLDATATTHERNAGTREGDAKPCRQKSCVQIVGAVGGSAGEGT